VHNVESLLQSRTTVGERGGIGVAASVTDAICTHQLAFPLMD
jgi:precorrin isomerase